MPKGQAFDIEVFKNVKEKIVKKAAEETLAVWSPTAGKRFRLAGFRIFFSKAAVITLEDESTVMMEFKIAENETVDFKLLPSSYLSVKAENKLNFKTSVEGALTGSFYGIEDVA